MRKDSSEKYTVHLTQNKELQQRQQIRSNNSVPFVHKVQTDDNKYIYDVNTGEILRVDSIVWDIIDSFGDMSKNEVVAKYKSKYKADKIIVAYDNIVKAQQKDGLLLSKRPEAKLVYDKSYVAQSLQSKRRQLILNVTENCNFRCSYCLFTTNSESWRNHSKRMMSWETARPAINDFLQHCRVLPEGSGDTPEPENIPPAISFYGGEPLLHFLLIKKCVKYIRERIGGNRIIFAITTNGSLFEGRAADFLASEDFHIIVSLDGPANVHNRNRRTINGQPTWKVVVNNLKNFLDRHPKYTRKNPLTINAILSRYSNALEVDEFFSACDLFPQWIAIKAGFEVEPEQGYFASIKPEKHLADGYETLYKKYLCNLIDGKINANCNAREFSVQRTLFEQPYLAIHKRRFATPEYPCLPDTFMALSTCIAGVRRVFVSIDGNYYPCERLPACEQSKIGNIREGVNTDKVYEMLKSFVECTRDQCRYCWCLPICGVGCYADIREKAAFSKKAKEQTCALHRMSMHHRLTNYCTVLEKNPHAFDFMKEIVVT